MKLHPRAFLPFLALALSSFPTVDAKTFSVVAHAKHPGPSSAWKSQAVVPPDDPIQDAAFGTIDGDAAAPKPPSNVQRSDLADTLDFTDLFDSSTNDFPRRLNAARHPSAELVYEERTRLNNLYGISDLGIYGKETRSIARYNNPSADGKKHNLCFYSNANHTFEYTMQNYAITTNAYLEVKYTYDMDWVYDSSTQGNNTVLNIKRPIAPEGYFRLGDAAFGAGSTPDQALLVKAAGPGILEPPLNYTEAWSDVNPDGGNYGGSSSWAPVPPAGYACLGHVWTLNRNAFHQLDSLCQ